ncbi:MAG TPA: hypothetical protein VIA82_06560 [Candidatus Limnocylindria bacterium]|jgi:hypothetical protein
MSDERSAALATELRRRGLDVPALLLLEAHRPLRPLLGNLAIFLSPIVRSLRNRALDGLAKGLASDAGYDALVRELERTEPRR